MPTWPPPPTNYPLTPVPYPASHRNLHVQYPPYEAAEWFTRVPLDPAAAAAPDAGRALPRLSPEAMRAAVDAVPVGNFIVVGRFHEAFAAHRLSAERWLVLDSHVRAVGEMETDALWEYVRFMRAGETYSLVVLGRGSTSEEAAGAAAAAAAAAEKGEAGAVAAAAAVATRSFAACDIASATPL